jgi:beta-N-acetylhexosaminidase
MVLVGRWVSRYQASIHQQKIQSFTGIVQPRIDEIHDITNGYNISLDFLSGDIQLLNDATLDDPASYLSWINAMFVDRVDTYNQGAPVGKILRYTLPQIPSLIDQMPLDAKIGQRFIIGVDGTTMTDETSSMLASLQPGGVILMGDNISLDLLITKKFVAEIDHIDKDIPMYISIDQEGWIVQRIPETLTSQADSELWDVCDTYTTRAQMLQDLWINLNFGLVVDISTDPNSFIYPRVFRGSPDIIQQKIREAIRCTPWVASTLKHYPGHGGTAGDSHQWVQTLAISQQTRKDSHLPPFVAGSEAGAEFLMLGHLITPRLDPWVPATLSPLHNGYIRESLGFTGLTITDDMAMIRTNYSDEDALEQALDAGVDILLYVDITQAKKAIEHARSLYRSGMLDEDQLDKVVKRVLESKRKVIE